METIIKALKLVTQKLSKMNLNCLRNKKIGSAYDINLSLFHKNLMKTKQKN